MHAHDNPYGDQTLVARLTADVPAAIATLAIRGPQACEIIGSLAKLSSAQLELGRIYYGTWQLELAPPNATPEPTVSAAEQVVVCRTEFDLVEVHCHGGAAVCQALLRELQQAGCKLLSHAEFPSEVQCPLARAAQQDLLLTTTDRAAAMLLDQMQGALRRAIENIATVFASGDLTAVDDRITELLHWSDLGLHLAHPWKVVLAGPPNVGKSSLMNALVGTRRAIVHHEPGTTRDWIEAAGAIDGLPVLFTDTAGVRPAEDEIEQAGVQRSQERLQRSDLGILVVDAQQGWTQVHEQLLKLAPPRPLIVWNKVDLVKQASERVATGQAIIPVGIPIIRCSAIEPGGVADLLGAISQRLVPVYPAPSVAVLFRRDHVERLVECRQLLREGELMQSQQVIVDWLVGKVAK